MTVSEALKNADRVVCHTCQTTTSHEVRVDNELKLYFVCRVCKEEVDEKEAEFGGEKLNAEASN